MILLENRIALLAQLGYYFEQKSEELEDVIDLAHRANGWFIPEFTRLAMDNIANYFLKKEALENWIQQYPKLLQQRSEPKTVGIVMAGNIPLVGFHDFLCGFISGHTLRIKLSSKDTVLWNHIFAKLAEWNPEFAAEVSVSEMLKHCDAYIATGSNNSARYFEYYFQKYPHIIRKNRTSVAILDGSEDKDSLKKLSDDVNLFFGLGCRNVTKVYVPKDYNFEALLRSFDRFAAHGDHNKFRNNYDYQLALYLLNRQLYMSNGHVLMVENESPYAPISVVHYSFYEDKAALIEALQQNDSIQCITTGTVAVDSGKLMPFGANQSPSLTDYADGVDTLAFLQDL
ncbi:acyl-CoA reductase [Taibaiella sp. KBW10]|uniref:acyl-CoA reductase n=1 Tax=Taibaiella sp. KBW10 TaxID=2153357 RepID=UPI000F58FE5E|nr:acyl-CoA reductase [Taibaiella sp. KBW10]RQO31353.1 acyl-CoA reductase [Taibaiella sp. KBW10]